MRPAEEKDPSVALTKNRLLIKIPLPQAMKKLATFEQGQGIKRGCASINKGGTAEDFSSLES